MMLFNMRKVIEYFRRVYGVFSYDNVSMLFNTDVFINDY